MDLYLDISKQTSINRDAASAHAAGSLDSHASRSSTHGTVNASRSTYGDVRTSHANMHSSASSLPQSPPICAIKQPAVVQRSPIGDLGERILSNPGRTNKNSIPALRGETAYWIRSDLRESPRIHELSSFALSHHHIISANRLSDFWKALNGLDKTAPAMPPRSSGEDSSPTEGSEASLTETLMLRIAEQYKGDEYKVTIRQSQIENKKNTIGFSADRAQKFSFTLTYDTMGRLINDPKGAFDDMLSGIDSGPKIFSVPEDYDPKADKTYTDILYESVLDALMARYQWMPGNLVAGPAKAGMPDYMAEMGIQKPTEAAPWYTEWARLDDCGGDFDKMAATIKAAPEVYMALDIDLEKFINNAKADNLTEKQIQDLKEEALLLIDRLAKLQDTSGIGQDSDPDTIVRTGADWINTFEGAFVDTPQGRARYNFQKDEEEAKAMQLSICVYDFMAAFGDRFYESIGKLARSLDEIKRLSSQAAPSKAENTEGKADSPQSKKAVKKAKKSAQNADLTRAVKEKKDAEFEISGYIKAYIAQLAPTEPVDEVLKKDFPRLLREEIFKIEHMELEKLQRGR